MRMLKVLSVCIALILFGCDMKTRGAGDTGNDIERDSSTVSKETDSTEDTGTGTVVEDESWRDEEIDDTWQEGNPQIEGPCDNDCSYVYEMKMLDDDWVRGSGFFELSLGNGGNIRARTGESVVFIMAWTEEKSSLYRQRALGDFLLNPIDHTLKSGKIRIYNRFGDIRSDKLFNFEYNPSSGVFAYSVKYNGRKWGTSLHCDKAPLIMLNHREYPFVTRGNHSSLFAFLVGEHYDWETGGIQEIRVFSPELERLDYLKVEKDSQIENRLIVHFPVDTAMAPWHSDYVSDDVYETNRVSFDYEHGIPVRMGTRDHFYWYPKIGFPPEQNLSLVGETVDAHRPELPQNYQTVSITVNSGDKILNGEIDLPSEDGTFPVVILMTGWDHMTRRGEIGAVDMYSQLGAHLASNGYVAVRIDSRDNLEDAVVNNLSDDVVAIIQAMDTESKADMDKVFLLAMGSGLHVAAATSRDVRVDVDGLVVMSPLGGSFSQRAVALETYFLENAGIHQDFIDKQSQKINDLISAFKNDNYDGDYWRGHSAASWRSILDLDLLTDASGLPPMLIMTASEDHLVPPSAGPILRSAVQAAGGDSVLSHIYGLTHAFTEGTKEGLWPQHSSIEAVSQTAVDNLVQWLDVKGGAK